MKSKPSILITILLCFLFILTACGKQAATATQESTQAPVATSAAELTATPAPTEALVIPCTIAFESDRDGNREIYRMASDGSELQNLTHDNADDFKPAFSPDGSQIAFVSNRAKEGEEGGQFIFIMNADGSGVRKLSQENGSQNPGWSPDGSQVVYDNGNDILTMKADGSEPSTNLTNSPEIDSQPDWSPDGKEIAWLSGNQDDWNLFKKNLQTNEISHLTDVGKVENFEWTIGGQLYLHWGYEPNGCFNCIMDADGKNIKDAGGKESAPQYLPFQNANGNRVGCAGADINTGNDEIFLIGDVYPDMLLNLTNNPGNDRNPTWPANCISTKKTDAEDDDQSKNGEEDYVFGYDNSGNDQKKETDLLKACQELNLQCIKGDNLIQLADQNVDAILSLSNNWNVLGEASKIREVVNRGIPLIILNAETDTQGAYNLSVESDSVRRSLDWMAAQAGGSGELAYYNIGNNGFIQPLIDQFVAENPGITALSQTADFQVNKITDAGIKALVTAHPNLKGIWANGFNKEVFWGVLGSKPEKPQAVLCAANLDMLQYWKTQVEENANFQCYASVKPGGTGYEGVYVAYYILSGKTINPDALGGIAGNTFSYDYPIITNDNLDEWLGKIDSLEKEDGNDFVMPAMSPDEILERWFIDTPSESQQSGPEVVEQSTGLIGYAGDTPEQSQRKRDFQMACDEMGIQCVYGNVPDLIDQGVKAIVLNTSSTEVNSQSGLIQQAADAGIPVFVLDAESKEKSAINITIDHYGWAKMTLGWMMEKMGNQGQIAYFDLDPANRYSDELKELLSRNQKIEVVESREGEYSIEKVKLETVDFTRNYPDLKAVWTSVNINQAVNGLIESGIPISKWPVVLCEASLNGLDSWRSIVAKDASFDCFALANPPGIAYDAAYTAYYVINGAMIDKKALEGLYGNSLYVNMPIIMNQDLQAWFERTKKDENSLVDEFMSPEDIRAKWFID